VKAKGGDIPRNIPTSIKSETGYSAKAAGYGGTNPERWEVILWWRPTSEIEVKVFDEAD
jgi:hypothetical protein